MVEVCASVVEGRTSAAPVSGAPRFPQGQEAGQERVSVAFLAPGVHSGILAAGVSTEGLLLPGVDSDTILVSASSRAHALVVAGALAGGIFSILIYIPATILHTAIILHTTINPSMINRPTRLTRQVRRW